MTTTETTTYEGAVERLLLADAGLERLVAAEARGDPERLAAVLAERGERLQQELLVRDRVADLEGRVPGREHRQVLVVELVDGLGVMGLELVLRYLLDPCANDLAEELAPRLAADRLGHDADRLLGLDEAEGHRGAVSLGSDGGRTYWRQGKAGGRRKNDMAAPQS